MFFGDSLRLAKSYRTGLNPTGHVSGFVGTKGRMATEIGFKR